CTQDEVHIGIVLAASILRPKAVRPDSRKSPVYARTSREWYVVQFTRKLCVPGGDQPCLPNQSYTTVCTMPWLASICRFSAPRRRARCAISTATATALFLSPRIACRHSIASLASCRTRDR